MPKPNQDNLSKEDLEKVSKWQKKKKESEPTLKKETGFFKVVFS